MNVKYLPLFHHFKDIYQFPKHIIFLVKIVANAPLRKQIFNINISGWNNMKTTNSRSVKNLSNWKIVETVKFDTPNTYDTPNTHVPDRSLSLIQHFNKMWRVYISLWKRCGHASIFHMYITCWLLLLCITLNPNVEYIVYSFIVRQNV